MTEQDHSVPTWENQQWHAKQLSTEELKRHAAVSIENRHKCQDCFCCACVEELAHRGVLAGWK